MPQPARLTASLLARQGLALPASGFAPPATDPDQLLPPTGQLIAPRAAKAVVTPTELAEYRPVLRPIARGGGCPPGDGAHGRVAMTLRLDRPRHRRLRLFAARCDRSCQDVILNALDAYLEAHGSDCPCVLADDPHDGQS